MIDSEARLILGLPPTYSARALKQAYRRAAATNHPDRGQAQRMVLVNEAYEVLSSEPAVVGPGPDGPAWAAADAEAFRSEPADTRLAPEHPLERYVRGVAGVLAASGWIAGMIDSVRGAADRPPSGSGLCSVCRSAICSCCGRFDVSCESAFTSTTLG